MARACGRAGKAADADTSGHGTGAGGGSHPGQHAVQRAGQPGELKRSGEHVAVVDLPARAGAHEAAQLLLAGPVSLGRQPGPTAAHRASGAAPRSQAAGPAVCLGRPLRPALAVPRIGPDRDHLRQLQPAPDHQARRPGRDLGGGEQCRDRLHADQFVLVKPHRGAVHGVAVLHARRHRPCQPQGAGQHDPPVHHLAQQPRLRRTAPPHRRQGKRSFMRL